MRGRRLVGCVWSALLVVLAACGSSGSTQERAAGDVVERRHDADDDQHRARARASPPTTIKVGVMMIDFDCVKQYNDDFVRARPEADVPDLHRRHQQQGRDQRPQDRAGLQDVLPGRATPANSRRARRSPRTTSVFAAIGTFYDPSGDAQLCFAEAQRPRSSPTR